MIKKIILLSLLCSTQLAYNSAPAHLPKPEKQTTIPLSDLHFPPEFHKALTKALEENTPSNAKGNRKVTLHTIIMTLNYMLQEQKDFKEYDVKISRNKRGYGAHYSMMNPPKATPSPLPDLYLPRELHEVLAYAQRKYPASTFDHLDQGEMFRSQIIAMKALKIIMPKEHRQSLSIIKRTTLASFDKSLQEAEDAEASMKKMNGDQDKK